MLPVQIMVKLANFRLESIAVPFHLSWGKLGYSRHVFITLVDEKGNLGHGEGVLYKTTQRELLSFIENKFTLDLDKLVQFEPALAFAIDTALLDLQEKIKTSCHSTVVREIFLNDPNLETSIKYILKHKSTAVKLKVGSNLETDKKTIEKIFHLSRGKLPIHLDANRAYSFSQALELAHWGKARGVILFEEPIHDTFARLNQFRTQSGLLIMLDESVQSLKSLDEAIKAECFDILNIKLSRLGGITLARNYINMCQQSGIKFYLGCSEELATGTRAILSLVNEHQTHLYALEGFGEERLKGYPSFVYRPGQDSKLLFLIREFSGVWKTRFENMLLRLWPN